MEKNVIITGASSGIGMKTACRLMDDGWCVYAIGRTFESDKSEENDWTEEKKAEVSQKNAGKIIKIVCDITDTGMLARVIKQVNKNHDIKLLINNAGTAYYGLHEELNAAKISRMVRTNLEAPMIICNLLLRDLKKNHGMIINISSVTAQKSNPHGCAYGATKAGLTSFSHSLFDEARKYGVRVINIEPDMTDTNLYRNADFMADDDEMARLTANDVAETVLFAVNQREGMVVSDITIKPQFHRIKKKK